MRRLAVVLLIGLASLSCRQREKIQAEPTVENPPTLTSTVRMADPQAAIQLIRGFHGVEQNSWRWTMSKFGVMLKPPPGAMEKGAKLVLHFSLPNAVVAKVGSVTLSAKAASLPLGTQTYSKPGEFTYSADVPTSALRSEGVAFEFEVDKSLPASGADYRELALVVSSAGLASK